MRVAYPGLWVREDVYATHGHYLDSHLTIPTLERLSVGAMSRVLGRPREQFDSVADYEAVGAPVFAWRDAVARDAHTGAALNGLATVGAWRALGGRRRHAADRARRAPATACALRRVSRARCAGARSWPASRSPSRRSTAPGSGRCAPTISAAELRRAGLRAMDEVGARLGLGDACVVFGHTHRAGPLPGDDRGEWRGRAGARLLQRRQLDLRVDLPRRAPPARAPTGRARACSSRTAARRR